MENEKKEFSNLSSLKDYFDEIGITLEKIDAYNVVNDSVNVVKVNDKFVIGFLVRDDDPEDYFENDEGAGKFIQFRNVEQRDIAVSEFSKKGDLFYLVDRYEHGNVHYSIAKTKNYPDSQFDVAFGCAVLIPCEYIQEEYKKLKKTVGEEGAAASFVNTGNSTLDEYSSWCNGEVYGVGVCVVDKRGCIEIKNVCYGYIGMKYAEQTMNEEMNFFIEKENKVSFKNKKKI